MNNEILGQLVGVFAFLFTAWAFTIHDEIKLKKLLTVSTLIWGLHFYLLQAYTAFAIILAIALRQYVSSLVHHHSREIKVKLAIGFIALNFVVMVLTWKSPISIFPFVASNFATVAMFLWTGNRMRRGMIGAELAWFVHNLVFFSYGGIAANFVNTSILIYKNLGKEKVKEYSSVFLRKIRILPQV